MKEPPPEADLVHEALQDRETVARYLHAIADGLASGTLRLASDQYELELHPQALIGFELNAHRDRGKARIRLRLTWREDPSARQGIEGLQIRSE